MMNGLFALALVMSAGVLSPAGALAEPAKKIYWFVPDGMRADPYLFNIYKWAELGELPNIKKMMENGTYGFSRPVYPGHTPVNFASLFTGSYPEVHGVSDGPMHTEGLPLSKPAISGFSSTAKKVPPIWLTLEQQDKKVVLLSVPGSTPPELKSGYTIAGRWGGWGAGFNAVIFQDASDGKMRREMGRNARLFHLGAPLTVFVSPGPETAPRPENRSYSPEKNVLLEAWGAGIPAVVYDDTDDGLVNYSRMAFRGPGGLVLADLKQGEWSGWLPVTLQWSGLKIATRFRILPIVLSAGGFFRVRFLYDGLNETAAQPMHLAEDLLENAGPMVDSVDSFPAQLVFYREDKNAFIQEADMSFGWHRKAASYILDAYAPEVFIHDIYSPNQMLTSRWWMGYVDPDSERYGEVSENDRSVLWREVKAMYRELDSIIGEYLARAGEDTLIVLSSDHGAVPLSRWAHLNNLFAKKGWLKFSIDPVTGEPVVDWRRSKVIYLKSDNVYIDPDGLHDKSGNWRRAGGPAYEKLREEVISALKGLKDGNGPAPLMAVSKWEDADVRFRLSPARVGDLVIANRPGYGWNEEMSEDLKLFSRPLETGYKQAIIPDDNPAMWTPFMIAGPGVKKNNYLGEKPVSIIDQYPTIMELLGIARPDFVQGRRLEKVFK